MKSSFSKTSALLLGAAFGRLQFISTPPARVGFGPIVIDGIYLTPRSPSTLSRAWSLWKRTKFETLRSNCERQC